ncbi:ketosteroid isomerase-like protein [Marmoricola sp. OAE513]|uniref:nuclear transport factor 2 family protein n=1 Tax=Marmoricola sp. OAE513 TaxID=2817894 RepID=UPI001AE499F3
MTDDRLNALEDRLARLEDERAITRLIGCYGPLVDAADADAVAALWAEDGTYDVEGWGMRSRADVHAMVLSPQHQGLVTAGCTHFLGPVVVTVEGDTAVAVCESVLVVHHKERFHVARAGANRFELVRNDGVWEILHRTTRALDGDAAARDLLAVVR